MVNGLVAFILPLILILKVAYYGAEATTISHEIVLYKQDCDDFVESQEDVNSKSRGAVNEDVNIELIMNDIRHSPHRKKLNKHREYLRSNNNTPIDINSGQSVESPSQKLNQQVGTDYVIMQYDFYRSVRPLPEWLEPFRIQVVTTILVLFTIVIVCTLIFDAVDGLTPD